MGKTTTSHRAPAWYSRPKTRDNSRDMRLVQYNLDHFRYPWSTATFLLSSPLLHVIAFRVLVDGSPSHLFPHCYPDRQLRGLELWLVLTLALMIIAGLLSVYTMDKWRHKLRKKVSHAPSLSFRSAQLFALFSVASGTLFLFYASEQGAEVGSDSDCHNNNLPFTTAFTATAFLLAIAYVWSLGQLAHNLVSSATKILYTKPDT